MLQWTDCCKKGRDVKLRRNIISYTFSDIWHLSWDKSARILAEVV